VCEFAFGPLAIECVFKEPESHRAAKVTITFCHVEPMQRSKMATSNGLRANAEQSCQLDSAPIVVTIAHQVWKS